MTTAILNIPDSIAYLTIGGGNFDHKNDGWWNLDYPFEATERKRDWSLIDVKHNLMSMESLPLPDNRFSGVYSEHALEHLPDEVVEYTVREIFRILERGGTFRIAVPDAEKFWEIVTGKDREAEEFPSVWRPKHKNNTKEQVFLDALFTPLRGAMQDEEVKKIVLKNSFCEAMDIFKRRLGKIDIQYQRKYPGAHVSWWNYNKLASLLFNNNFIDISAPHLSRTESRCKAFRGDYIDRTAYKCTVRIEASKPA